MTGVVLIVEDNERNLKLVRDVLGHAGFSVLEARDAEAGIELARVQKPDAVLMDINLPGMTGFEALTALRSDTSTASIPVLAVTAYAMKDDRARILAAGFDGYVEKPVDIRALPGQVEALIRR
ncbi:response regulator [Solirubrobacter soli]|uniref:response regulator n=1 Tax=Solirubrobacter soli TaxID=363832 RepID=UPI0003F6CADB|nr:response regulator [Solirubrobacter soli]